MVFSLSFPSYISSLAYISMYVRIEKIIQLSMTKDNTVFFTILTKRYFYVVDGPFCSAVVVKLYLIFVCGALFMEVIII